MRRPSANQVTRQSAQFGTRGKNLQSTAAVHTRQWRMQPSIRLTRAFEN